MRRIGVLMPFDENDPDGKLRYSAFIQALADLGWTDGRNVQMDLRWAGDDINRTRSLAQELVRLQPHIIVTSSTPPTAAVQRETRTIPIVFAGVGDPVAGGIVPRLNQPGVNVTGFGVLEATLGGKWLELLSEIVPGLKRAAIMFNPDLPPASAYMPLLSYGTDEVDTWRRAAAYVDRIVRGAKPGDLPVQLPTKFEMVVNRKTATALGLVVPPSIRLRATEVIE